MVSGACFESQMMLWTSRKGIPTALLIRINNEYRHKISDLELYEAAGWAWRVGARREKAQYAMAINMGSVCAIMHGKTSPPPKSSCGAGRQALNTLFRSNDR